MKNLIYLSEDIELLSKEPMTLVVRQGQLTPKNKLTFPDFYAETRKIREELVKQDIPFPKVRGSTFPVIFTPKGLALDIEWAPFSEFGENSIDLSGTFLKGVMLGEHSWKALCPVMKGPASLIGQIMLYFGKYTGAGPIDPGYRHDTVLDDYPIIDFFKSTKNKELIEFRDRDNTLLDLACRYQHWKLASFLWDKGVTWSEGFLKDGSALESFIIASKALQGSETSKRIDDEPNEKNMKRVDWIKTWLDRYNEQGGTGHTPICLDLRGRKAKLSGWPDGQDILDSAASLWLAYFFYTPNGHFPSLSQPNLSTFEFAKVWVDFWTQHDVELSEVPISNGSKLYKGLAEFFQFNQRADNARQWQAAIQTWQEEYRLEHATPQIKNNGLRKPGKRL